MAKGVFLCVILFFPVVVLNGCKSGNVMNESILSEVVIEHSRDSVGHMQEEKSSAQFPEGMVMKLSQDTLHFPVTTNALTLIIKNNTSSDIVYSDDRRIQILKDGKWEPVPLREDVGKVHWASQLMRYYLKPSQEERIRIGLHVDYQNYTPGHYRLCKKLECPDSREKQDFCVEFMVVE